MKIYWGSKLPYLMGASISAKLTLDGLKGGNITMNNECYTLIYS